MFAIDREQQMNVKRAQEDFRRRQYASAHSSEAACTSSQPLSVLASSRVASVRSYEAACTSSEPCSMPDSSRAILLVDIDSFYAQVRSRCDT